MWKDHTGKEIGFVNLDLAPEYDRLVALLLELQPDAIVHFAEQRAAPYSMRSEKTKRYTVDNNVRATHNLLCAIVDTGLDTAVVHLGTMGVYGYGWSGSAPIPEGYLTVQVPTPDGDLEREILHPANPGSVYHMTKTLDQLMFAFYAKNDGVRITDLHQGIVWGTQTPETVHRRAPDQPVRLRRRLRHRAQPVPHAGGHRPPADRARHRRPDPGVHPHPRHRALHRDRHQQPAGGGGAGLGVQPGHRDLPGAGPGHADLRADRGGDRLPAEPPQGGRGERPQRDTSGSWRSGLEPTTLSEGLLEETREVGAKYAYRADFSKIVAKTVWRAGMEVSPDLLR